METLEAVTDIILETLLTSVRQVIPVPAAAQIPEVFQNSVAQSDIGVLVGFTGDLYGRIVIQGPSEVFGKIGETMFGMPLEGEMLHSFVGELANMVAGNTSTLMSSKGQTIDITPPTVMVGHLQLYGIEQGISVTVHLENAGEINIILLTQH
ncbi:chemotaxis protein CheX [Cohnella pontilimi]|uniref:Chemotaxis protein CheX n=1 Tax=Cohnella pontilimi TaxID=2564100 RepID=A0A4U0FD33_9BACL|nr:chemotaxis protein CheX [Cohnella pontilimi]TJY42608.1 chemotaxis protein CheX [Cohnella pontilimi]